MAVFSMEDQRWSVRVTLRGNKKNNSICQTGRTNTDVVVYRLESSGSGGEMEEWGVPEMSSAAAAAACTSSSQDQASYHSTTRVVMRPQP